MNHQTPGRNPRTALAVQLAHATSDAELYGVPHNPLRPDVVATIGGERYSAVAFLETSLSRTERYSVTVTRASTGERVRFGQVLASARRLKDGTLSVNVSQKGAGSWKSLDAALLGLMHVAAGAQAEGVAA